MVRWAPRVVWLLVWSLCHAFPLLAGQTNIVRFQVSAPYSSDEEIGRRFGFRPPLPDYHIERESFRLGVPDDYSTNSAWGLLVWLSPNDDAELSADWEEELGRRHIIVVAPFNCGNDRHPIDRLRLAFDATSNVCRRYRIDRKRIYVGGLSSGARLACMIGISCGDIFNGTLCVCGVNFYLNLPAGGNLYFPSSFSPAADVLAFARAHAKYVLVTGENDPDRETIKLVATRGFLREGFKQVLLLDVPGLQQALPGLGPLGQALGFLGETQIPSAVPAAKTPVSSKPRNPRPAASPTPDKPPASAGRAE